MTERPRRRIVSGHYAGPVSRALAAALDATASGALFALGTAGLAWVVRTLLGFELTRSRSGPVWVAIFIGWLFVYYWAGLALVGKTPGKALLGLRVVARDGSPLLPRWAALRVLVMPISFALLGVGLLGAVISRERRTLHDVIARTVEVYDWGDRSAELPTFMSTWLDRRSAIDTPTSLDGPDLSP
jgi:uncharacterized RDD family membrane protein YckC